MRHGVHEGEGRITRKRRTVGGERRLYGASSLAIAVLQEGIVHYVQHDVY